MRINSFIHSPNLTCSLYPSIVLWLQPSYGIKAQGAPMSILTLQKNPKYFATSFLHLAIINPFENNQTIISINVVA